MMRRGVLTRTGVAEPGFKLIDSLEHDGVERRAAQRAPRRPLLPPRADGLDDAPPAEAGVAAGPQLAVGRAREAHRARVPFFVGVAVVVVCVSLAAPVA